MKKTFITILTTLIILIIILNLFTIKDAKLLKTYNNFKKEGKARNISIKEKRFSLIKLPLSKRAGVTIKPIIIPSIIILSKKYYNSDSLLIESMLFHEFGHLLLEKDHDNTVNKKTQIKYNNKVYYKPNSVMYKTNITYLFYRTNRTEYINELFLNN